MKRVILLILTLFLVFMVSCKKSPADVEPDKKVIEGYPTDVRFTFDTRTIIVKNTGLTSTEEQTIKNLDLRIFNSSGELVSHDHIEEEDLIIDPVTGAISINTAAVTGSNMSIYVVANFTHENTELANLDNFLSNSHTVDDMRNELIYNTGGNAEVNRVLMMMGSIDGQTINIDPASNNFNVQLKYITSKHTVIVQGDFPAGNDNNVMLADWKLINYPKFSYLIPRESDDAVDPTVDEDFITSQGTFDWNDTIVGGKASKYTVFYIFENRRGGRKTNVGGTNPYDKTISAPDNATAIEMRGYISSETSSGVVESNGIIATIYLGANSYSDYNILREQNYIHLLRFRGVDDIAVDSRLESTQTGYQVDILNTTLDSHFDYRPLRILAWGGGFKIETSASWLRVSDVNLMEYSDNGSRVHTRPAVSFESMSQTMNILFISGGSTMEERMVYIYADEYDGIEPDGTPSTRTAQITITPDSSTPGTPITITQKGYLTMGNVGLSPVSSSGVYGSDNNILVVEHIEEARLNLTPGLAPGQEKTTTMQWGFNKINMTNGDFKHYRRNGLSNTLKLINSDVFGSNLSYGRVNTSTSTSNSYTIPDSQYDPIFNTYPARYCYEKNKDVDGSGVIEADEIFWYLPSQEEMQLMNIGLEAIQSKALESIETTRYSSSTVHPNTTNYYTLSLWMNYGDIRNVPRNTYTPIRCVRQILNTGISDTKSPYVNGTTRNIMNSGFNGTAKKAKWNMIAPIHTDADEFNLKISSGFKVAKVDMSGTYQWYKAAGYTSSANNKSSGGTVATTATGCNSYTEGASTPTGTWRLPTIKEMYIIFLIQDEITSSNFTKLTQEYYWTATTTSASASQAWRARKTYNNAHPANKTEYRPVRCIYDL